MKWWIQSLKKSFDWSGRASRTEFLMFWLLSFLFYLVCLGIIGILLIAERMVSQLSGIEFISIIPFFAWLLLIAPSTTLGIRRLHDIGKSGWYLFIGVIPVIGAIMLLIWSLKKGDKGENQYGPQPLGPEKS